MNVREEKTINVHERLLKCSWTVHEHSWTTNETFIKIYNIHNILFKNRHLVHELGLFMNGYELR